MTLPALPLLARVNRAVRASYARRPRVWCSANRAYVEIVQPPPDGLEERVAAVSGVQWARVNAALGRLVVAFDPSRVAVATLVTVVDETERDAGAARTRSPTRPSFPGDVDALRTHGIALLADVGGIAAAVSGALLRAVPFPIELASLVAFIESQPRLRRMVADVVGGASTDTLLALANAFGQGLAQGQLGLAVDAAHRVAAMGETAAERRTWTAREPELAATPQRAAAGAVPCERAAALPRGPVETYADRATIAAGTGFAATLAATRRWRRASDVALAAMPKAAGIGREGFATQLGRILAERRAVVCDRDALRRLDRVDTLVVDVDATWARRPAPARVVPLTKVPDSEITGALYRLFDPERADRVRADDGWMLGPLARLVRDAAGLTTRLGVADRDVLGLARGRRLVAVVPLTRHVHPAFDTLAASARRASCALVLAGEPDEYARPFADDVVAGGDALASVVASLQRDGHVVAVVSAARRDALARSDCGIGLTVPGAPPPWGAHLLVDDLATCAFVVEAIGTARDVSRRSVRVALGGASVAATVALTAPPFRAGARTLSVVNGAAVLSFASGTWSALELSHRPLSPPVDRTPWHAMPPSAVLHVLGSSEHGLATAEARRRLAAAARHERTVQPPQVTLGRAFLDELSNPLTPVLAVGAGVSAAIGSLADAAVVASVTGLSALFGGIQRSATERAVARLAERTATRAWVERDGRPVQLTADELVAGDVVALDPGDIVPADCRILSSTGLETDESSLTGESSPVAKRSDPVAAEDVADRRSMLYEGTTVAAGRGRAVVVATGTATEAGRSLAMSRGASQGSAVDRRLHAITAQTVPVALGAGAVVAANGILRGSSLARTLATGVGLTVAAVPEGLPFLVTAAQLAAARRLSTRNALVKNPRSIEALGRAEVLCFDKTGTLTEGRLRLREVSDGITSVGVGRSMRESFATILVAAACATPRPDGSDVLAHPTDQAVVDGGRRAGIDIAGTHPLAVLPFEPARGFHATLVGTTAGAFVFVKGAPEVVLPRCTRWTTRGDTRELDTRARQTVGREVERLARLGHRVLAVARRSERRSPESSSDGMLSDDDARDLELLGFLAIADAPRRSATKALQRLRDGGVQLVMITGDHPSTAQAIASEIGLLDGGVVLTGADVATLDRAALDALLPDVAVFARVSPTQKVDIVRAFQRTGRAVAMTGDGANDAPAIRLADVGIALGPHATSAARAAADVVVGDDRLETIVAALVEGRAMWASVRDALAILLGGNLGEIAFTVAGALVGGRPPLNARQLLLVNLLTDLAPALVLATRPPGEASTLLREGPDSSLGGALTRDVLVRAATTSLGATTAYVIGRLTGRPARARSIGLAALVGTQLAQTAAIAGRDVRAIASMGGSAAALVAVVQTPGISRFFGCTPLGPVGWATATGAAVGATALGALVSTVAPIALPAVPAPAGPQETPWMEPVPRSSTPSPSSAVAATGTTKLATPTRT